MRGNIIATALLSISLCAGISAQFGGGAHYQRFDNNYWPGVVDELADGFVAEDMIGASAYYWFRLKDVRIEFLPEVGYAISLGQNDAGVSTDLKLLTALVNVMFYPFDLINDCDCPTFSKQGSGLQKGFFIALTGGLSNHTMGLIDESDTRFFDVSERLVRYGVGVGLDIGVSDLLTIVPHAYLHWEQNPAYDGLAEALGGETVMRNTDFGTRLPGFGLRAIFRPDYLKRR
ncbi:MAG: hypothetical protein R3301_16940 [Saprospiraceae bacterium]|nr:hypothetical protein [Saprospiraceae bacterium]